MVLSIISALFCLPLLVFAGIGYGDGRWNRYRPVNSRIVYGIQLLIGLLQGVVAIGNPNKTVFFQPPGVAVVIF